ncbi:MAG: hypothetical protein QM692_23190 [Thermomicrobiales bacterium]
MGQQVSSAGELAGGAGPASRRQVLRAAGALLLAAAGLLGLAGAETVTPPEGAAAGPLGGRRGKNRRGINHAKRRRRRRRRRRRANARARVKAGANSITGVAVDLCNRQFQPVNVRSWVYAADIYHILDDWTELENMPPGGPEPVLHFVASQSELAIELKDGPVIIAESSSAGPPRIDVGTGEWTVNGWYPRTSIILDAVLAVDEMVSGEGFEVVRLADSSSRTRFKVTLT